MCDMDVQLQDTYLNCNHTHCCIAVKHAVFEGCLPIIDIHSTSLGVKLQTKRKVRSVLRMVTHVQIAHTVAFHVAHARTKMVYIYDFIHVMGVRHCFMSQLSNTRLSPQPLSIHHGPPHDFLAGWRSIRSTTHNHRACMVRATHMVKHMLQPI